MSDGLYDNMRAYIPNKKSKDDDEASDTYDTIDWLVKIQTITMGMEFGEFHTPGYATYSLLSRHPALKAVSPQACISDFSLMIFTITEPIC
jgi:predicted acyl esterase